MAHLGAKEYGTMILGEMLTRTNLLALVGGGSNPKYADNTVLIYDHDLQQFIMEYTCATTVLSVRVCNSRIVIAIKNEIYVYSFPNHTELLFSFEKLYNPKGLLELTPAPNNDRNIICFPAQKRGAVQIVDLGSIDSKVSKSPSILYAHENELAYLSLNQDGTLLATASKKGTIVRIFDTIKRVKIQEFRRGTDEAKIYCINFSGDSNYVCCSSDKGTVHIFALKDSSLNKRSKFSGLSVLGGYVHSQWDLANFAFHHDNHRDNVCICAFGTSSSIYAVCFDGSLQKYIFRSDGSCKRVSFDSFLDICEHWYC
ncbi:WD repeat domain phosphoinositide-interacting protein 4 [Armadillidium nasatum]|uniref:WD repeat domain phosphoinositide-interacting protein 4 n=1 Tax=Armadillidium nasatum TaxID=96803 RepID=A0A5N5TPG8_9CRUS|nr:WD repeat domain phosphoinositide-interacting protein 4 [Armadillidium nasatum]